MKFGFFFPNFKAFGEPNNCIKIAQEIEKFGWDGIFFWDHILHLNRPRLVSDPWIVMAGIAAVTKRIKFGTMITPLTRRRPWKVARETVTLDRLSNGRFILGIGLGAPKKTDFEIFGEEGNDIIRGEMLDESLEIITSLWKGDPFKFNGKHYQIKEPVTFLPKPVQRSRIPIWVGGYWPRKPPFRRAARFDGIIPGGTKINGKAREKSYQEIMEYIEFHKEKENIIRRTPFDLIHYGPLPTNETRAAKKIIELENLGVTWWLMPPKSNHGEFEEALKLVQRSPPKFTTL